MNLNETIKKNNHLTNQNQSERKKFVSNLISSHDLYTLRSKIIRLIRDSKRYFGVYPLYPRNRRKVDPARAFRWIRWNLERLEGKNSRTKPKQIVTKLVWDGRQSILARRRTSIPVRWGSF